MNHHEQRNLELTHAYYEAGAKSSWDLVGKMLTDDFCAIEASTLPVQGIYYGVEGLQELYVKVFGMMDITGYDIYQITAGGDYVVSLMNIFARDSDGSQLSLGIAESLRWRDGKLCEMKPYWFDTNLVARAVAAHQQGK